jgi:hypothetical protein
MRFAAGRPVLHRNFQHEKLSWVRLMRVVSDDERGLLLWICPGSPSYKLRTADDRTMRSMPFAEWVSRETRLTREKWEGPGVLQLVPDHAAHSVYWVWDDNGAFGGWYVNLEEPGVRWDDGTAAGIDIVDQDLDICVEPNRSWLWKDEHEMAERIRFPEHYWVIDPDAVKAEGERLIPLIEAGKFPFDGSYCDFRPDPAWAPPELPDGWDRPRAHPENAP